MSILNRIWLAIKKHHENVVYPYKFFGWFAAISYPLFYFIWRYTSYIGYENIYLRLAVTIICIPLILKNHWPEKIKFFSPYYLYLVLTYSLPFLFTFLLIENDFSKSATLNFLTIVTLSILLMDWKILILLYVMGISAAYLVYYLFVGPTHLPPDAGVIIISMLAIMIFGILFTRNKEVIQQTKHQLQTIKAMSANMAHELRTPIRTISSYAANLQMNLPKLFTAYQKAQAANLDIPEIDSEDFDILFRALDNIQTEAQGAFTVINMLMVSAGMADALLEKEPTKHCSIVTCVETALQRYPFDLKEKELVHWPAAENKILDFNFLCKELLIIHVIFNLLKNAFYQIKKAGKGEIYIWLDSDKKNHILHFKDTGSGIPKKDLKRIFDQFYSKSLHGTGIGLAFCKAVMQNLHGDIKCFSRENEFAEFVLFFPKLKVKV